MPPTAERQASNNLRIETRLDDSVFVENRTSVTVRDVLSLEVEAPETIDVRPLGTWSYATVNLTNTGTTTVALDIDLFDGPMGWRTEVSAPPTAISPRERVELTLAFEAPEGTSPGPLVRAVSLRVNGSTAEDAFELTRSLDLMVLPTQAATLSDVDGSAVLPLRDVPLSGAVRTLTFRNVGNLPSNLTFQVDPPVEGWSFEFEPPFVEGLPVGSTTDVQVTAIPDATAEALEVRILVITDGSEAVVEFDVRPQVDTVGGLSGLIGPGPSVALILVLIILGGVVVLRNRGRRGPPSDQAALVGPDEAVFEARRSEVLGLGLATDNLATGAVDQAEMPRRSLNPWIFQPSHLQVRYRHPQGLHRSRSHLQVGRQLCRSHPPHQRCHRVCLRSLRRGSHLGGRWISGSITGLSSLPSAADDELMAHRNRLQSWARSSSSVPPAPGRARKPRRSSTTLDSRRSQQVTCCGRLYEPRPSSVDWPPPTWTVVHSSPMRSCWESSKPGCNGRTPWQVCSSTASHGPFHRPRPLVELADIDHVISLEVPDDLIVDRITGRSSCPACGHVHHDTHHPPPTPDTCGGCGSVGLVRREDDSVTVVESRLRAYHEQTAPLATWYEARGLLRRVNGTGDIDAVSSEVLGSSSDDEVHHAPRTIETPTKRRTQLADAAQNHLLATMLPPNPHALRSNAPVI